MSLVDTIETYQMTNVGDHIDGTDVYQSNRNLLDNPFYTINQHSFSSMPDGTSGYTVDRWKKGTRGSASKLTNGVRLSTSSTELWFTQVLPSDLVTALVGETVTLSVKCANLSGTWRLGGLGNAVRGNPTEGIFSVTFTVASASNTEINISTTSTGSIDVLAVKLELGSVSTLANDVPPDYETELMKCKAYFQRVKQPQGYTAPIGFGIIGASSNILRTLIPLSSPLRDATSITASATNIGQMKVWGNGSYYTPSAITGRAVLNGHAVVDITVSGSLQNYSVYHIILQDTSTYIDLSADLQ